MLRPLLLLAACALLGCTPEQGQKTDTGGDTGDGPDNDGDGYGTLSDCDDDDPAIHPGADEVCDGINNDCDAAIDEPDALDAVPWYRDADLDGYGDPEVSTLACERPPGFLADGSDCDDTADTAHPGAEEICNDGADNDCDGDPTDCVLSGDFSLAAADAAVSGDNPGDQVGAHLTGGDLDGDGRADLIVGVPNYDDPTDSGAVHIIYSSAGMISSMADATTLHHSVRSASAGEGTSFAGDLDGDGYGDLLVGAPGADASHIDSGVVYILPGPLSDGDDIEATASASVVGESSYDRLGSAVAGSVDANGDGVLDLFVGVERWEDGSDPYMGAAYLLLGPLSGTLDLETYDARVTGLTRYDRVGAVVAGGDVDGDGRDDMVVGSWTWPSNGNDGVVGVFLSGGAGDLTIEAADALLESGVSGAQLGHALSAGDTNGDGYDDVLLGAPLDTGAEEESGAAYLMLGPLRSGVAAAVADAVLLGAGDNDEAGAAVACDGDVNGDGRADLLVGAPGEATVSRDAGRAYFFYGPLSGTHALGDNDIELEGAVGRQRAGAGVSLAADPTGDGLAELAVAAPSDDTGGSDAGMVYLLYGVGL